MQRDDRILTLLYDRGAGSFGIEELAAAAGIDRAGTERALEALAARGHRFERTPVHGVRLIRPTVLDACLIERDLPVRWIGRHVICFDEVGSTSDVAFDSRPQAAGQALVVTAESQRSGRGRMGRQWVSPPGSGVLASVLLHRPAWTSPPEALTVAAGVAVAEGIEQAAGVQTALVWPNDVVVDGAKVSGVMVEVRDGAAVIGFGINVQAAPSPQQLAREAACLAAAAGRPVERVEVCRAVLVHLDELVEAVAAGRLDVLRRRWLDRCNMVNRRWQFLCSGLAVSGRVLDLSPLEGLVLLTDDGRRVHLPAATTSLLRPGHGGG